MVKTTEVLVEKLMEPVPTISEDATVLDLVNKMKAERTTFIPVVNSDNKLVGCIFDYNLLKLVKQESMSPIAGSVWIDKLDRSHAEMKTKDIMDTRVVRVLPSDTIDSALKVMSSNDARVLTVVDREGKFMGVLRIRTIFEKLLREVE